MVCGYTIDMNDKNLKRILIFSTAYYPFIGGAEIAVKEIADRIDAREIRFDMITIRFAPSKVGGLPKFEKIGNVNVHRISSPKLLFPFLAFFKAIILHRKNKYHIIWSIMANRAGFAALFFKLTHPKIKYLLTLQEGDKLDYPKQQMGFIWFAVGGLFKKIFTKADAIQTISTYLEKWARDMGYRGTVEVVPNGVDVERFKIQSRELKSKLGIKDSDKVIITVSRLVKKNAVGDIIEALKYLPKNTKLLILGTGPLEQKLKLQAMKVARQLSSKGGIYKLQANVLFLGHIDQKDIPQYLHISDVFVRPSLSEGMGNSFIEAMAASVPIVATPVGGITDFLEDEKTGLFCNVNDPKSITKQVTKFFEDSKLREQIIKNAYELVSAKYDWNLIAKDMKEKVFDKLTDSNI